MQASEDDAPTADVPAAVVPEDLFAKAYSWALDHARLKTRNRVNEIAEAALDAATSGVLWAKNNFDPAAGAFDVFSASAVRRCVQRAVANYYERARPTLASLDELDEDGDARFTVAGDAAPVPLTINDLPDDLAFAVRLVFVDGYDLREVALLMGISTSAVQRRLRWAAELLAPELTAPVRKTGARRVGRTRPDREV